jgi:hypothetical protein
LSLPYGGAGERTIGLELNYALASVVKYIEGILKGVLTRVPECHRRMRQSRK